MAITIGTFTCDILTAQPFSYEGESTRGLTFRAYRVSGILEPEDWEELLDVYNSWRDTRITDEDTLFSESVGTTVSLSVGSANGISATSVACWFAKEPSGEQLGTYVSAEAVLIDATEALEVLKKTIEKDEEKSIGEARISLRKKRELFDNGDMEDLRTLRIFQALIDKYLSEDLVDLGTESLGDVTIKLTKPATSRAVGPTVGSTAGGFSLVQGPLQALVSKSIEGYVTGGTIADLMTWYDTTIAAAASAGTWFPTRPPSVTGAESVLVAGVKTTRYTVSAEVAQLI